MPQAAGSRRCTTKADALVAAIQKGQTIDAAAASVSVKAAPRTASPAPALQQNQADRAASSSRRCSPPRQGHVFDGQVGHGAASWWRTSTTPIRAAGRRPRRAPPPRQGRGHRQEIFQDMGDAAHSAAVADDQARAATWPPAAQALGLSTPDAAAKAAPPPKRGPAL